MEMIGELVVRAFTGGAFGQNGYLVKCVGSDRGIIVDPGAAVGEILETVKQLDLRISSIVITHAHVDHVEGLARAKRETAAAIYLHKDAAEQYAMAPEQAKWFGLEMEALPPVDHYIGEDDLVTFGGCALRVRNAPGHAPGHVILIGDGVAMVGDCIFAGSIGRTDLPGGDLKTLMRSIRKQILTLPNETVLYSGHGPETTVGHERATNQFLRPDFGGSNFA
jgi:glyoxylase-like metal-dependent hydrolase (beta-lactamase superfamily II)